jgi:hypothetical protein
VTVHGLLAEDQLGGDRPVGPARGDQAEYLDLAGTQSGTAPARAIPGERVHVDEVGARAEQLEGLPRGRQLEARAAFVVHHAACLPDQDPHSGRLVGGFQVMPQPVGAAQCG